MGEVLEYEAGAALDSARREDIEEVLNYRKAMRQATEEMQKLPLSSSHCILSLMCFDAHLCKATSLVDQNRLQVIDKTGCCAFLGGKSKTLL